METLVEVVSRFLPLKKNGGECHARCVFHDDTGESLRIGNETWRCIACGEQERYEVADAAAFLQAFLGCDREHALHELENVGAMPEQIPIQAKLRRPCFFGLNQAHKRPDDRIWIHGHYPAVDVARELIPERVHLGLIEGRSWDELGLPPKRYCVLLPTNTETARGRMERLADVLTDAGHTVRIIDPSDRPEHWTLVDAAQQGMTGKEIKDWAATRMKPYPKNDAAQQDGGSQPVDASAERGLVPVASDALARQIPAAPAAAASPNNPYEQQVIAREAQAVSDGIDAAVIATYAAPPPELPAASPATPPPVDSTAAAAQQPVGGAARAQKAPRKRAAAATPEELASIGMAPTSPIPESPVATHRGNGKAGEPLTPPERADAYTEATRKAVLETMAYVRVSDVRMKAIEWLWPGKIPLGMISMIQGDPKLGKSQICASLASIVSNSGQWPVTRERCEGGTVIILSSEDPLQQVIGPRLVAAGANISKVVVLQMICDPGKAARGFDLASDIARLGVLLDHFGDVRLIIIDPVSAYIGAGSVDSHKNAEVRGLLRPLSELAATKKVAIIFVNHLTKDSSRKAMMRGQMSVAFVAVARAVWGVLADEEAPEDNPRRRLFLPVGANLAEDSAGLAYQIEGVDLGADDEGKNILTSRILWEAGEVHENIDAASSRAALSHEERGDLDDAKAIVLELLSDGSIASKALTQSAHSAGVSDATLRRAKKSLGVVAYREGGFSGSGAWYCKMPKTKGATTAPQRNWQDD